MLSKLFKAAGLLQLLASLQKCSSKTAQAAFSGGAESVPVLYCTVRGEKIPTLLPPLHILNINTIRNKQNCEEQQCQTQAFRVHESDL